MYKTQIIDTLPLFIHFQLPFLVDGGVPPLPCASASSMFYIGNGQFFSAQSSLIIIHQSYLFSIEKSFFKTFFFVLFSCFPFFFLIYNRKCPDQYIYVINLKKP